MEGKDGVPPGKKQKRDNEEDLTASLTSFDGFQTVKILKESHTNKCLFIHGKLKGDDAVVLLERSPFDTDKIGELMSRDTGLVETLKNDIYSTYSAFPQSALNGKGTSLIFIGLILLR